MAKSFRSERCVTDSFGCFNHVCHPLCSLCLCSGLHSSFGRVLRVSMDQASEETEAFDQNAKICEVSLT